MSEIHYLNSSTTFKHNMLSRDTQRNALSSYYHLLQYSAHHHSIHKLFTRYWYVLRTTGLSLLIYMHYLLLFVL